MLVGSLLFLGFLIAVIAGVYRDENPYEEQADRCMQFYENQKR